MSRKQFRKGSCEIERMTGEINVFNTMVIPPDKK